MEDKDEVLLYIGLYRCRRNGKFHTYSLESAIVNSCN